MKRSTVMLTDQQAALLEIEQRRQGVSKAAIIRQALDQYLGGSDEPQELWFIGLGESDGSQSAADMEEYLARHWADDIAKESGLASRYSSKQAADASAPTTLESMP